MRREMPLPSWSANGAIARFIDSAAPPDGSKKPDIGDCCLERAAPLEHSLAGRRRANARPDEAFSNIAPKLGARTRPEGRGRVSFHGAVRDGFAATSAERRGTRPGPPPGSSGSPPAAGIVAGTSPQHSATRVG